MLAAAGMQLLVNVLLGSPAPTVGASGGLFGLLLAFEFAAAKPLPGCGVNSLGTLATATAAGGEYR